MDFVIWIINIPSNGQNVKKISKRLKKDINMINYLKVFIYHTYINTIFSFKRFYFNFKTQIENV